LIGLILLTLIFLNNTTYPGGTINISVEGCGNLTLPNNCTYFCGFDSNEIHIKSGTYSICVSFACKPGNYTLIADKKLYNFKVLNASYEYLLNATVELEEKNRNLKKTIKKLMSEKKNLTSQLNYLINLTNDLKKRNEILQSENLVLNEKVAKLSKQVEVLKNNLTRLNNLVIKLENDKRNLEFILGNLKRLHDYIKMSLAFILAFLFGSYLAILRR
jgi:hypothetical protein